MKKVIAIVSAIAALGTTPVFAQARNFEGFSLGANVEFDNGSSSATDGTSDNGNSTGLGLQARYDWALGDNFLLGLGATASTGKRTAGTYVSGAGAYTADRYSIDLMPGYALSDNLALYAKVSSVMANASSNDGSSTNSVQGIGYGIGLRGLFYRNMYWLAGVDSYRFNDVTFNTGATSSLKGTVFSLGVGYKF